MDRLVVVCRAGSAWVVKIRLSEWSLHPGPLAESGLRWRTARRDRGRRRTAVRSRLLIRRHDSADRSRHAPRATRVTPAITNGLVFTPVNGKLVAVGAGVTLTGTTVGGAAGGVHDRRRHRRRRSGGRGRGGGRGWRSGRGGGWRRSGRRRWGSGRGGGAATLLGCRCGPVTTGGRAVAPTPRDSTGGQADHGQCNDRTEYDDHPFHIDSFIDPTCLLRSAGRPADRPTPRAIRRVDGPVPPPPWWVGSRPPVDCHRSRACPSPRPSPLVPSRPVRAVAAKLLPSAETDSPLIHDGEVGLLVSVRRESAWTIPPGIAGSPPCATATVLLRRRAGEQACGGRYEPRDLRNLDQSTPRRGRPSTEWSKPMTP